MRRIAGFLVLVVAGAVAFVGTVAPREYSLAARVRADSAGAFFVNPATAPLTFSIEPRAGGDGQTVRYRGTGYTPGGDVVVLMTADGLIVAEDHADAEGAIAGSFQAPDRAQLTGETGNDIPVFAIDQATGRESERVTFTYTGEAPTPEPVVGRPVRVHAGTCDAPDREPRYDLTDLTVPEATPEGAGEAAVAEAVGGVEVLAVP
jgi:hypothetical protein